MKTSHICLSSAAYPPGETSVSGAPDYRQGRTLSLGCMAGTAELEPMTTDLASCWSTTGAASKLLSPEELDGSELDLELGSQLSSASTVSCSLPSLNLLMCEKQV